MIRHLPNKARAANINIRMKNSLKETISVIGLGVVGLTTAIGFAFNGGSCETVDLYEMACLQAKSPCFWHEGANLILGETV
jgi:2-polyprenyl-6-methoxyphenol hydroxylase-like FAD-dependent oxidoreductase